MATPARNTRSRAAHAQALSQPLPPVNTRWTNTYGSRGTPSLDSQMGGFDGEPACEDNFATRRTTGGRHSATRTTGASSARGTPTKVPPKRKTRAQQATIREESDDNNDDDDDEGERSQPNREHLSAEGRDARPISNDGTAIDQLAPYEQRLLEARRKKTQTPRPDTQDADLRRISQPWQISVFFLSCLRYLDDLFRRGKQLLTTAPLALLTLVLLVAAISFFSVPSLPARWEAHRERMTKGARLFAGIPTQPAAGMEKEWPSVQLPQSRPDVLPDHDVPTTFQASINANLVARLQKLEEKTGSLDGVLRNVQTSLSDVLPRLVVVDVVGKRLRITEDFYAAMHEKLRGDDGFWAGFLEKNQKAIDEMENRRLSEYFDEATESQHVVSAQTALEMIRSEHQRLLDLFNKTNQEARAELVEIVRDIADEAVNLLLEKNSGSAKLTGGDTSQQHFIENTLSEMQNVNYFSPKSGARVIPQLTSPSAVKPQGNVMAKVWGWAMYPPNPSVAALLPWFEYGDAWCAAKSTGKGMAQLGIKTQVDVVPEAFVVEHLPASGSLTPKTAPRDVELWMDAGDVSSATSIEKAIAAESTRFHELGGCGEAPGEGFVCVSRGTYDMHATNWVQKFPMFVNMSSWFFKSRTFVAKVNSNWGADTTCLYRLRLHGKTEV